MSLDTDAVREQALEKMAELSNAFNDAMERIKTEEEAYWATLDKEQQLAAFNCVVRRIYEAEMVENRSYRGVLYSTFGFGPEAYARAQMAGYLAIHNAIMSIDSEAKQLAEFAKYLGVPVSDQQVDEFLLGKWL